MSARKDPAWKYGTEVSGLEGKNYKYIKCNFCLKVIKGGVSRMKNHLAGNRKDAAPCVKVSSEAKNEIIQYLKAGDRVRMEVQRNREELVDTNSGYQSENRSMGGGIQRNREELVESEGENPSMGDSVSRKGASGPMDRFVVNNKYEYDTPKSYSERQKEARSLACMEIGRVFFENGIPFDVANSPYFISMSRLVCNFGRRFKPLTSHELSTWILDEEEKSTQAIVDGVKETWSKTGVSVLCNGRKDTQGRQLINFLVNNPKGTVFWRSVDASDAIKDAKMLCDLLDEVVMEVGEDHVIQVVTDNALNFKAAGELLMERRKRLWWTPCAAHCIDLMLEKIGDLPQHANALKKSKEVSKFIYNNGWALALMRKHTKRELIFPAGMSFATAFLTLENMYSLKEPLEQMFKGQEWTKHALARTEEAKKVKQIILKDKHFWPNVSYAVKTTKPLVNVLKMAASENKPFMGFIYESMDKAKEEIAENLGGEEESYKEIWSIIDDKWEFQMHRHLHAAAYYLNPHYHFDEDFSTHPEIKLGFLSCLEKFYPDPKVQEKVDLQTDVFHYRKGLFSFCTAFGTRKKRSPVDWWLRFGDETPELQSLAVKVLGLTCSASACERNWSTFNQIRTKKRNRLHMADLSKSVYIMHNKRLKI